MTYLVLSIVFSCLILISFKLFTRFNIDKLEAITINYLTASFCSIILINENTPKFQELINYDWFWYSALISIFFIVCFILFAQSSQKAGVGITAIASRISLIIPICISYIFLNESLNYTKIIGIILSIISLYFIIKGNEQKKQTKLIFILLPLILFFANGINESLMKIIETKMVNGNTILFISCIFTFCLILGLLYKLMYTRNIYFSYKNIIAGIILGFFNFSSTYFFLKAISKFESAIFFPIVNISIVSISVIIGYIFFKEKLTKKNILGIILAIISIFLISTSN
ncbi:MAG: EamA family transporter [Marinifilaceae bacterium]|jgi:drug/metabolite transporter (DMT)-like permease|nr:EamA family transporter [Marinifilaceae bacterium]